MRIMVIFVIVLVLQTKVIATIYITKNFKINLNKQINFTNPLKKKLKIQIIFAKIVIYLVLKVNV